jgi:RNase P protein component
LAVSRRVDKRATVRNRIKRVIRESFRQHFLSRKAVGSHADPHSRAGITGEAGVDFVVIPRAEAARSSNARLFRSLEAHWARREKQIEG